MKSRKLPVPIESRWQFLEDLIESLRIQSEREYDVLLDARIPNSETLNAIDETEKGIGLIECEDADDLFKKLEI